MGPTQTFLKTFGILKSISRLFLRIFILFQYKKVFIKKKVCLPTDPKNFGHVTGNKTYFSFGLNACSKITKKNLFLFSNKMLVIRAGIHIMHVRIANREDPDQTASSALFVQDVFVANKKFEHLLFKVYILQMHKVTF